MPPPFRAPAIGNPDIPQGTATTVRSALSQAWPTPGHTGEYHAGMPPHLTILTGASRGMGLAMARQLLRPGHTLLCLSRRSNPALADEAAAQGAPRRPWPPASRLTKRAGS